MDEFSGDGTSSGWSRYRQTCSVRRTVPDSSCPTGEGEFVRPSRSIFRRLPFLFFIMISCLLLSFSSPSSISFFCVHMTFLVPIGATIMPERRRLNPLIKTPDIAQVNSNPTATSTLIRVRPSSTYLLGSEQPRPIWTSGKARRPHWTGYTLAIVYSEVSALYLLYSALVEPTAACLGSMKRADASTRTVGFSPSATRVSMCPSTHALRPSTLVVFARSTTKAPAGAGAR
jgi:hypothetical protein